MSTYRNVKAQIAKLEKQAADLFKKEVAGVVAKIRTLMAEYGLTTADLGSKAKVSKGASTARKTKAKAKPATAPKYQDPVSGKTWTGHGKAPAWLAEALKSGKSKDDFLIGKKVTAKKTVAKKAVKAVKVTKPAKAAPAPKATKKPAVKKPVTTAKPAKVKAVRKAPAKKAAATAPAAKA